MRYHVSNFLSSKSEKKVLQTVLATLLSVWNCFKKKKRENLKKEPGNYNITSVCSTSYVTLFSHDWTATLLPPQQRVGIDVFYLTSAMQLTLLRIHLHCLHCESVRVTSLPLSCHFHIRSYSSSLLSTASFISQFFYLQPSLYWFCSFNNKPHLHIFIVVLFHSPLPSSMITISDLHQFSQTHCFIRIIDFR